MPKNFNEKLYPFCFDDCPFRDLIVETSMLRSSKSSHFVNVNVITCSHEDICKKWSDANKFIKDSPPI